MHVTRALAIAIVVVAGCKVGPEYAAPPASMPESYAQTQPPEAPPVDLSAWWASFNDPVLDQLIEQAAFANLDVRIAQARVREARGTRRIVAAEDDILVDVGAGVERRRTSEFGIESGSSDGFGGGRTSNLYDAGFDATWELDLFGRVSRSVDAADADIDVAVNDRRATLVTVLAETAQTYVELRTFQRRLAIAQENIRSQADTLELSRAKFDAGLTSEFDVARSRAQLQITTSQVPALEQGVEQSIHALSVLLGLPPAELRAQLIDAGPIPQGPASIPVGAPADLLLRRPDLLSAERALAAETARIGVAEADLYPRITLLGSLGISAEQFEDLFEGGARTWSLGPRISWPLFDGGRIRGNIEAQDARAEQALYRYEQTVLTSLREVEDSLVAHAKEQVRLRTLTEAVAADSRAVEIANALYTGGIGDFLNVLDSQRSLYLSQDQMVQSESTVTTNLIALYKALGGGWEMTEERPAMARNDSSEATTAPPDAALER